MHADILSAARGMRKADLVLKNAFYVNVFTEQIEQGDIAICNDIIVGIGEYEGEKELDCSGLYVTPGFIDAHIHLESSMLKPIEFVKAVLPHGTTAVITDPHEIANVCGRMGIEYMMKASEGLPLDIYFVLPSCVPATVYDENGFTLLASDIRNFYQDKRVVGLGEVMDYYETIRGGNDILQKIKDAKAMGGIVDGHAPGVTGKEICSYITTGIVSDHECVNLEEALEKLKLGLWIMIREGTAAKNLKALLGLFSPPFHQRVMLVTDDKHPYDILQSGHMDAILRKAVALGAEPCIAVKMATYNAASYFGLKGYGAVAPGYHADLVILSELKEFQVQKVIKSGQFVVTEQGIAPMKEHNQEGEILNQVYHTFHCDELNASSFAITTEENNKKTQVMRVIKLIEGEITTEELLFPIPDKNPAPNVKEDILKLAVIERHHKTGHIGIGFVSGYGLKQGAIASSVAHDSHNIIVIGTNDQDIAKAANTIRDMQGGWAIVVDGKTVSTLPLPIAGLISDYDVTTLSLKIREIKSIARRLGVPEGIDPFMSMAFISLPVIPELRMTTTGLFKVSTQEIVPIIL